MGGGAFQLGRGQCRNSISLTPPEDCFCFHCLLCPHCQGAQRPEKRRRVKEERGWHSGCHPTCHHSFMNLLEPWLHVSLTQGFMSHFQWNVTFGQTTKKTSHYKLGNVWKENYLPKAALNQCCPNIYLAHTQRSCVHVCQRL